jgi:hypothetical protein
MAGEIPGLDSNFKQEALGAFCREGWPESEPVYDLTPIDTGFKKESGGNQG